MMGDAAKNGTVSPITVLEVCIVFVGHNIVVVSEGQGR